MIVLGNGPGAEVAQAYEQIVCVWAVSPAAGAPPASVAATIQSAIDSTSSFARSEQVQAFSGQSGAVYAGCTMYVQQSAGGQTYDSILGPLKNVTLGTAVVDPQLAAAGQAGVPGATLGFVDYMNDTVGSQLAALVANADNGASGGYGGDAFLSSFDAIGPQTPYLQQTYSNTIAVGQATNTAVGNTAAAAQKAAQAVTGITSGVVLTVVAVIAGLYLVDRLVLRNA